MKSLIRILNCVLSGHPMLHPSVSVILSLEIYLSMPRLLGSFDFALYCLALPCPIEMIYSEWS